MKIMEKVKIEYEKLDFVDIIKLWQEIKEWKYVDTIPEEIKAQMNNINNNDELWDFILGHNEVYYGIIEYAKKGELKLCCHCNHFIDERYVLNGHCIDCLTV